MKAHNIPIKLYIPLLYFILQLLYEPTESFASWFIQPGSCWVDMRDTTEEIIMHEYITPVTQTSHTDDVQIDVYEKVKVEDGTSANVKINPIHLVEELDENGNKERSVVYIENLSKEDLNRYGRSDDNQDGSDTSLSSVTFEYILKLNVTEDVGLHNLEYVMDAKVLPQRDNEEDVNMAKVDEDDNNNIKKIEEAQMIPEFTHRRGCKNLRAHGKKGDKGLKLKIHIPLSVFSSNNIDDHRVDVVAGWACGHVAVTLTHPIQFRIGSAILMEKSDSTSQNIHMEL